MLFRTFVTLALSIGSNVLAGYPNQEHPRSHAIRHSTQNDAFLPESSSTEHPIWTSQDGHSYSHDHLPTFHFDDYGNQPYWSPPLVADLGAYHAGPSNNVDHLSDFDLDFPPPVPQQPSSSQTQETDSHTTENPATEQEEPLTHDQASILTWRERNAQMYGYETWQNHVGPDIVQTVFEVLEDKLKGFRFDISFVRSHINDMMTHIIAREIANGQENVVDSAAFQIATQMVQDPKAPQRELSEQGRSLVVKELMKRWSSKRSRVYDHIRLYLSRREQRELAGDDREKAQAVMERMGNGPKTNQQSSWRKNIDKDIAKKIVQDMTTYFNFPDTEKVKTWLRRKGSEELTYRLLDSNTFESAADELQQKFSRQNPRSRKTRKDGSDKKGGQLVLG